MSAREHADAEPQPAAEPDRAPAATAGLTATVLSLQRRAGNAATRRWLARFEDTLERTGLDEAQPLAAVDPAKKTALQSKYSVTLTGAWTAEDFADLEAGLGMLTTREAGRLNGFELRRVSTIGSGSDSGLTTVNGSSNNIQYADSAFDHGSTAGGIKRTPMMVNGVPQGQHVVLHEVGHVVLYTNTADTAEKAWNAGYLNWIKTDISTQPNGKVGRPAEELYAEAFACFHTGAAQLQTDAPKAHAYFKAGSYMS